MRRMPGTLLLVTALALLLASTALAGNGGIAPVAPRSSNAGAIRDAYWLILAVTGAIFVIVETALVVFVVRFRRGRRSREAEGAQVHGNTNLEIAWTVVPVLIVAAIIGFVFAKLPDVKDVPSAQAAGNAIDVKVEAHQFYWRFVYPDGQISINTMVVPVDRVVTLTIVSTDVVHGWWIPALGGQTDAIPGRVNHTWFRADRVGSYEGQCAQLCGLLHAKMTQTVKVVPQAEYASFLASHSPSSSTVAAETFSGACSTCHGFQGKGDYGPTLQNRVFAQADITDLLSHGRTTNLGHMPAVGDTWSQPEIAAVIRYLKQTKGGATLGG